MMKRKNKIEKHFFSTIDRCLAEFDQTHTKTASQLAEIKKHERVFYLRDHSVEESEEKDIWEF